MDYVVFVFFACLSVIVCLGDTHAKTTWRYQVHWGNGNVTEYTFPTTIYSDCVYDVSSSKLLCMRNHAFHDVTSRWIHEPDLISYVSVRCLDQSNHSAQKGACFCKDGGTVDIQLQTPPSRQESSTSSESVNSSAEMFSMCQLEQISKTMLQGLSNLEILDLSNNRISSIKTDAFFHLSSLVVLNLMNNDFSNIPLKSVCLPDTLTVLNLSYTKLTEFPTGLLGSCPLRNQITTSSTPRFQNSHRSISGATFLSSLLHLDMSHCNLQTIPTNAFWTSGNLKFVDLSHNRITSLPANPFLGAFNLSVIDLSGNELQFLPTSFCEGLEFLEHLSLQDNRLTSLNISSLVPCAGLQNVNFSGNRISLLSGLPISLFRLQFFLVSGNELTVINQAMFSEGSPIKYLDMSGNNIQYLSSDALHNAGKLQTLLLRENAINESETDIKQLTSNCTLLEKLDLSHNIISKLDSFFLSDLSLLEDLDLSRNSIDFVDEEAFSGLDSLTNLDLSGNRIKTLHPATLNSLETLKTVNLSQNVLSSMLEYDLPLSLQSLDLSWNLYSSVPTAKGNHVRRLSLASNVIHTLRQGDFNNWSDLRRLDLKDSAISTISETAFTPLLNLRELILSSNELESLPNDVLISLSRLELLTLSRNRLRDVAGLKIPHSLRFLDVSFNNLGLLSDPINLDNTSSYHLTKISFRQSHISFIGHDVFKNLIYLREVDLRDNFLQIFPNFNSHPGAAYLLGGNKVRCSCRMKWLKTQLSDNDFTHASTYVINSCHLPPKYFKVPMALVKEEEFLCNVYSECPNFCSCFAQKTTVRPKIVFCGNKNLTTVPKNIEPTAEVISLEGNIFGRVESIIQVESQAKELYLNSSRIYHINETVFEFFPALQILDLSKNYLNTLSASLLLPLANLTKLLVKRNGIHRLDPEITEVLPKLNHLDFSMNNLEYISPQVLNKLLNSPYLQYLFLGENPFQCNCENLDFILWVQSQGRLSLKLNQFSNSQNNGLEKDNCFQEKDGSFYCARDLLIRDISNVYCYDQKKLVVITNLNIESLGCGEDDFEMKATILIVCVCVVLLIVLISLCYFHRALVSAVLYHKLNCACVKRDDSPPTVGNTFSYDIMLIYDDLDRKLHWWMESILLPRLESPRWHFRIKGRRPDMEGESESNEMSVHGVKQSRCSLVLVSGHFGHNRQCVKCLQQALQQKRMGVHTIVMVTWGELTRQTLDHGVRAFITKGDHLPITSHFFWSRLFYLLPIPVQVCPISQRNKGSDTIERMRSFLNIGTQKDGTNHNNRTETSNSDTGAGGSSDGGDARSTISTVTTTTIMSEEDTSPKTSSSRRSTNEPVTSALPS